MYGLVNQAIRGLVESRFGEQPWQQIRVKAGLENDVFLSMESYDDAITYNLVGAASEILELAPEEVLHAFGKYWVLEVAKKNYAELMKAAGSTIPDFLANLDQLHSRVLAIFPELQPPSFRTVLIEPGKIRLYYYSEREGLEPFVLGLVAGLGVFLKLPVAVRLEASKGEGRSHAEFLVTYSEKAMDEASTNEPRSTS